MINDGLNPKKYFSDYKENKKINILEEISKNKNTNKNINIVKKDNGVILFNMKELLNQKKLNKIDI